MIPAAVLAERILEAAYRKTLAGDLCWEPYVRADGTAEGQRTKIGNGIVLRCWSELRPTAEAYRHFPNVTIETDECHTTISNACGTNFGSERVGELVGDLVGIVCADWNATARPNLESAYEALTGKSVTEV